MIPIRARSVLLMGNTSRIITRTVSHTASMRNTAATATATKTAAKASTDTITSANNSSSSVRGYTNTLDNSLKGNVLDQTEYASNKTSNENVNNGQIDWSTSWYGLGRKPFGAEIQKELLKALQDNDIEIKPDGLLYLPEIKYRRILNRSFGAGGWGLVPRSETIVTQSLVTREYGLVCNGQLVGVARGEQDYFNENGIPTATEGCKSNALMRCCKDLGIGSELWDPVFIKKYKETNCTEKFVEHVSTKRKKKIWLRKDRKVEYPYK